MGVDEQNPKLKLYIRLPVKINDELQVKELHPDIEKVTLPRQPARWCVVSFPNRETLFAAKEDLKVKKVNGKKIYVGPYKKAKKGKSKQKPVADTTESLLALIERPSEPEESAEAPSEANANTDNNETVVKTTEEASTAPPSDSVENPPS